MNILGIIFFSFGVLFILFGISIFTPLFPWAGKRFNSSNSSYSNYNQPGSIRVTSLVMGICFFVFGIFITIASAALLNTWNTQADPNLSRMQPLSEKPIIENDRVNKPLSTPPTINPPNNSSRSNYTLDCPSYADVLNMRKAAGLNTEIIGLIPCDAILIEDTKERYYQDGVEWYLVKYQNNTGWVAGKYLKPQVNLPKKTNNLSKLVAKKRP
jgi:hypothetical protein